VKTAVRFSIREARREDERFLSEMLYEATTWRPWFQGSPMDDDLQAALQAEVV
jgi:hypothetical protein